MFYIGKQPVPTHLQSKRSRRSSWFHNCLLPFGKNQREKTVFPRVLSRRTYLGLCRTNSWEINWDRIREKDGLLSYTGHSYPEQTECISPAAVTMTCGLEEMAQRSWSLFAWKPKAGSPYFFLSPCPKKAGFSNHIVSPMICHHMQSKPPETKHTIITFQRGNASVLLLNSSSKFPSSPRLPKEFQSTTPWKTETCVCSFLIINEKIRVLMLRYGRKQTLLPKGGKMDGKKEEKTRCKNKSKDPISLIPGKESGWSLKHLMPKTSHLSFSCSVWSLYIRTQLRINLL